VQDVAQLGAHSQLVVCVVTYLQWKGI